MERKQKNEKKMALEIKEYVMPSITKTQNLAQSNNMT